MIKLRTGQAPNKLTRHEFSLRFRASFADPAFTVEENASARIEEIG